MTDLVVTLPKFTPCAERIAEFLSTEVQIYDPSAFSLAFSRADRIVAVMAVGIAVRSVAPLLRDKWTDPAVVVVSPDCRVAIPLVGGHHGANELAKELAGIGLTPVITTATEVFGRPSAEGIAADHGCTVLNTGSTRAVNAGFLEGDVPVYAIGGPGVVIAGPGVSFLSRKGEYVVGIGCRKEVSGHDIVLAVRESLKAAGLDGHQVLAYATTSQKAGDSALRDAVRDLSGVLVYVDDEAIRKNPGISPSGATRIGLSGVAEPAALAVSRAKVLVQEKRVYGRVTVAIAR
ncbi:cobalt-precorrin 5A hydrolase [Methanolinea mesophila]|uniref:cobalt-precorrin 5A hydrolase n=1 Tax=Methanolinea mesophila TaxID=547055 RepID=UPI001AE496F0|nr:cobalt-precorrin 5A hydrolase [Methanolinea mesophila]MBP1929607.1 cobalt-precorrin 5A hydrolase [Methanolinea mesophila]